MKGLNGVHMVGASDQ